jgi:hypothetical protein
MLPGWDARDRVSPFQGFAPYAGNEFQGLTPLAIVFRPCGAAVRWRQMRGLRVMECPTTWQARRAGTRGPGIRRRGPARRRDVPVVPVLTEAESAEVARRATVLAWLGCAAQLRGLPVTGVPGLHHKGGRSRLAGPSRSIGSLRPVRMPLAAKRQSFKPEERQLFLLDASSREAVFESLRSCVNSLGGLRKFKELRRHKGSRVEGRGSRGQPPPYSNSVADRRSSKV